MRYIRKRNGVVKRPRIDACDIWDADITMAGMIVPLLKEFRERTSGIPLIDEEDVPPHIKGESQDNQWLFIIGEMIYGFEFDNNIVLDEANKEAYERAKMGRMLFGKYFDALWT